MMNRDPLQRYFDAANSATNISNVSLDERFPTGELLTRLRREADAIPARKLHFRFWHRTTVASIAAVLAIAGTAAAITLLRSPVADTSTFSCYSQVSLNPHAIEVFPIAGDPLSVCGTALHWKELPESPSPKGSLCVLANGTLVGFPPSKITDVCTYLKLPTYDGGPENHHVAEFEKAAIVDFDKVPCIAPETARNDVLHLFAEFNLTNWHVRITRNSSGNACATLAIHVKDRRVDLVGIVK
jgi:hypothetical protein